MSNKLKFIVWEDKVEHLIESFNDQITATRMDEKESDGLPLYQVEVDAELVKTQFYFSRLMSAGYTAGISDMAKSSLRIVSEAKERINIKPNTNENP